MPEADWYLVGYDIRDDHRLRRISKVIGGYGERIQYSVFRCRLTSRQLARMEWELDQLAEPEDSLLIAKLCASCARSLVERSTVDLPEKPPWEIV